MKVLLIPSDNGLGHIRRLIILSNYLSKKFNVTIAVNKKKRFFKTYKKVKLIGIKKIFQIKKKNYQLLNKKKINSIIKNFDYIIVDNLPDFIKLSKKVIFFSNFFWHKEFNLNNKRLKKIEKEILEKKIKIFGNYLFQRKYFKIFKTFLLPFFGNYKKLKNKKNILISIGTAEYQEILQIKKILLIYFKKINFRKFKIYLDPKLYDKSFTKYNVLKANYSKEMYDNVKFALIKPGLGTVEECLKRGIPIVSYTKKTFPEFKYNAKILINKKLGYNFNSLTFALNFIIKNFYKKKLFLRHENNCKKLKWNGEKIIENYLLTLK